MSQDKKPGQISRGDKIYMGTLISLAIICFGFLVGLMHHNAVHGVITSVILGIEALAIATFIGKADETAMDNWKSLAVSCALLWGLMLGTVAGLMEWSLAVFFLIGGSWAVIGFGFGALLFKVGKAEDARRAKANAASAPAQQADETPAAPENETAKADETPKQDQ